MAKTRTRPPDQLQRQEGASVDPEEVEKFSRLAAEWWDPKGKFRPLHLFNPIRLGFLREFAVEYFNRDATSMKPFEGLTLVDIGCGGGLVSEPMARMGFRVLGADASEKNVKTAAMHAADSGLDVTYRAATAEQLAKESARYDVVLNLEIVEHVADLPGFLTAGARLLKPKGIMVVATINRTLKSLILGKLAAEYVLRWLPPGTHDWNRFVTPGELTHHLEETGLTVSRLQGVSFNPLRWEWQLSSDTDVNYMAVAEKR